MHSFGKGCFEDCLIVTDYCSTNTIFFDFLLSKGRLLQGRQRERERERERARERERERESERARGYL